MSNYDIYTIGPSDLVEEITKGPNWPWPIENMKYHELD